MILLYFILFYILYFLSLGKNNNSSIFNSNQYMSFSSSKSSLNNSSNPSNSLEEGIFNSIGLGSKASSLNTSSLNRNSSLSTTENSTFSFVTNILTGIIVVILIILLVINGLQYYFGINVIEKLKDLFSKKPQVEIKMVKRDDKEDDEGKDDDDKIIKIIRKPVIKQQVFNIPGNYFNYTDAKSLCKAEGARLATYSEVEDAYNNGAEWCNYGWSEGQMALFPTQKTSYDKLQKIEGHEKDCGRPGVNGGYIENPNLQYGANCYGYKPRMTK
jgi:hypothetical protein